MPKIKKTKKEVRKKNVKAGLTLPVYGVDGKEKTPVDLPKEIFSVEVNPRLLAQYVRVYLANQRQGNASTKTRGEITGSTRKIYKQKGTGNARHGDRNAPIFVGGGVVGGPKPRDFSLRLNRKQTKKALFTALSMKLKERGIYGLSDDFLKIEAKTKIIANFLKAIGVEKEKILLVLPKKEKNNLILSSRNLANIKMVDAYSINPYDILRNKKVLIVKQGLQVLVKYFLTRSTSSGLRLRANSSDSRRLS
ncbi:50S ribosomal protein L4 [Candidatus Roizmanbacteria bacterium RIFCSPHIGHO2_01_FULL_35_10]|uniref:Large ribosomal subunit protein uL4 n=1 Tax=Candidatus Roizmanbacteria bacterium RIFCSPLOWO2_01_FULL_35_13 TaxID=1802055 RepID=A0A1F7IAQ9_9BACT|nr:MAG: 50S ribosomal protein L4 [Candidatus Roizmanbacteria bacterium RIFCSPHIGHO2_01_FULL_35_10]OGK40438.1 MAG: 50S ribosomal protein L4 [Candidatus Roizmanbacteria bacterium RIFCSPLOWO2_01_FULL_35_13]